MDGTLELIFAISQTVRNIKKLHNRHQNNFKRCEKFQSLKDLAQKLSQSSLRKNEKNLI